MARNLKNLSENLNRNSGLDNFKFFFGGVRITEILTNFSLGGKFFVLSKNKRGQAMLSHYLPQKRNLADCDVLQLAIRRRLGEVLGAVDHPSGVTTQALICHTLVNQHPVVLLHQLCKGDANTCIR